MAKKNGINILFVCFSVCYAVDKNAFSLFPMVFFQAFRGCFGVFRLRLMTKFMPAVAKSAAIGSSILIVCQNRRLVEAAALLSSRSLIWRLRSDIHSCSSVR